MYKIYENGKPTQRVYGTYGQAAYDMVRLKQEDMSHRYTIKPYNVTVNHMQLDENL